MVKAVPAHIDTSEIIKAYTVNGETPEIDMLKTRAMVFLKYRNYNNAVKAVERKAVIGSIVLQCEERIKKNPYHPDAVKEYRR